MRIIGVDPGTALIGYGVVEYNNRGFSCITYGTITNPGKDKGLDYRNTEQKLSALVRKFKPEAAAMERLFFFSNQKTALAVSEMRGVLFLTLARFKIPILEFTPLEVKQGVSGYGRADKLQIERMTRMILGIKEPIKPDDAADALAIAICGSNNYTPLIK